MEKQGFQAGESRWQNSKFKFCNKLDPGTKDTEIWIEKDGFKPSSRLDWKIVETF